MKYLEEKNRNGFSKSEEEKGHLVYNEVTHELDFIEYTKKPNWQIRNHVYTKKRSWLKRNHEYINMLTSLLLAFCTIILTAWGIQLSKINNDMTNQQNLPIFVAMKLDSSNIEILNQGGPIRRVSVYVRSNIRFHSYASLFTSDNDFDYYLAFTQITLSSYNYSSNSFTYSRKDDDRLNDFMNILAKRIRDEKFIPNLSDIRLVDYISIHYTDYSGESRDEYYFISSTNFNNDAVNFEATEKPLTSYGGYGKAVSLISISLEDLDAIDMDVILSYIRDDYSGYERHGYLPSEW